MQKLSCAAALRCKNLISARFSEMHFFLASMSTIFAPSVNKLLLRYTVCVYIKAASTLWQTSHILYFAARVPCFLVARCAPDVVELEFFTRLLFSLLFSICAREYLISARGD